MYRQFNFQFVVQRLFFVSRASFSGIASTSEMAKINFAIVFGAVRIFEIIPIQSKAD